MRGRLSRYFSMSRVVLPGLDSYLWKGGGALTACDMKLRSEAPALHVDLLKRDEDEEDLQIRTRQFRLAQLRYLLCSEEEHPSLRHAMGDTPWTAREGEAAVLDVIKRLNRFRLYSSECAEIDSPSALNLLLNTELSHSRQKASGTQALLGQVSYKELKIVRSGAVLGLNGPVVDGSAYFLQGESTVQGELPPSLRLTGDLWKRLDRQRAVNRSDRESRELDIDLDRFFYSMVRPSEELKIVHTSVERMVSRVSGGRVLAGAIEWKSAERP